MSSLHLRELHSSLHAQFTTVSGAEAVAHYGEVLAEHAALHRAAGVLDLSFRSRLCLVGADRTAFLHGQVTNDVRTLKPGGGCYAALVSAKGKMQSDLNIYRLDDELLLDFEPGLARAVMQRLEKYIITEDVQIVDAAPPYGLFSVQGPKAVEVVQALALPVEIPAQPLNFAAMTDVTLGQIYLMNQPRTGTTGFDLFVPTDSLGAVADKLVAAARAVGGCACGWEALEVARIEAGIPRFGVDMDEATLPPEAGLEARAISYSKGCYIGQEVIARIRTYGQVAKSLRKLRLTAGGALPARGDKLFRDGKEVGFITSAALSPALGQPIALAYVRREVNQPGSALALQTHAGEVTAWIS